MDFILMYEFIVWLETWGWTAVKFLIAVFWNVRTLLMLDNFAFPQS